MNFICEQVFVDTFHEMLSCDLPCVSTSVGTSSQLFLSLIQTLAAAQCAISPPELWPEDYGKRAEKVGK